MSAMPTTNRLVNVLILSGVIVLLANEQIIINALGLYLGAVAITIGTLGFLWIREFVKESGLLSGDLNNAEQVGDLIKALPTIKATEQTVQEEKAPEIGA
jgi:hypothetical protein